MAHGNINSNNNCDDPALSKWQIQFLVVVVVGTHDHLSEAQKRCSTESLRCLFFNFVALQPVASSIMKLFRVPNTLNVPVLIIRQIKQKWTYTLCGEIEFCLPCTYIRSYLFFYLPDSFAVLPSALSLSMFVRLPEFCCCFTIYAHWCTSVMWHGSHFSSIFTNILSLILLKSTQNLQMRPTLISCCVFHFI